MTKIVQHIKSHTDSIEKRMLKVGLTKEQAARELTFAIQLATQNPSLAECEPNSVLQAVINAATVGLTLNPAAKEGYIIPRKDRRRNIKIAVFEPSYIGLSKLAMLNGEVTKITTQLVHQWEVENDQFRINLADDLNPVYHSPCLFASKKGEVMGVYSIATMKNGTKQVEWMDIDEARRIRGFSESFKYYKPNSGKACVWVDHEGEMVRKTNIKRLVKFLPKANNEKLAAAINLDNQDYQATAVQLGHIEQLLATANITEPQQREIESRLRTGYSHQEAKDEIEFLFSVQVEDSPRYGGALSMKARREAVEAAVNNPSA